MSSADTVAGKWTPSVVERGRGRKIQALKKAANGFRNRERFKTATCFYCGGLDRYPDLTH